MSDLLFLLDQFERKANAGHGREVFQAYIYKLFADGSGSLRVEIASSQAENDDEQLLNRVFAPTREFRFESTSECESLLQNMDLVVSQHPEAKEE